MSRKGPTKNEANRIAYVAQTPAFLRNFGQAPPSPSPPAASSSTSRDAPGRGREPLPERPREGKWAGGSDDEGSGKARRGGGRAEESDEEDEWEQRFGGGGDEGPQVVVLKEGKHLTAEDLKRERRIATGQRSPSPPKSVQQSKPDKSASAAQAPSTNDEKRDPIFQKPQGPKASTAKRKLVGAAGEAMEDRADGGKGSDKKKKKKVKGMLSFDEADGDM